MSRPRAVPVERLEIISVVRLRRCSSFYLQSGESKSEESLVALADVDSVVFPPGRDRALVDESSPHEVREHRETQGPQNKHAAVQDEVQAGIETSQAVEAECRCEDDAGQERRCEELESELELNIDRMPMNLRR